MCCKISLEGQLPLLHIKIQGVDQNDNLHIFGSYKDPEPSIKKHSHVWAPYKKGEVLRFQGEKGGAKVGQKVFTTKYVYVTFLSALGGTIEVRPVFVDQEKANSIKYVTAKDTNKIDAGIDESNKPP